MGPEGPAEDGAGAATGVTDAEGAAMGDAVRGDELGNEGQSLGTTASRGFLWTNLGIITRYLTALILAGVLARVLTPAEYAVMATLMIITFYFDNALDLGMGAALVYEQEEGVTHRVKVAYTANVLLGVGLAVVCVLLAPLIAGYFKAESYTNLFRLLGLVVLLSGFTTVPWSLFTRGMDFRRRSYVEVARDLTRFGLTIVLAWAGLGAWAVLWGLVAAYAVWLVLTYAVLRFRPRFAWDPPVMGELFAYAWRMAGNRLLGILALNGDYLVVGNRNNAEYPLYYQAFRLPEFIIGGQLNAMSAVLFPMYSRVRSQGDAAMRAAMLKALRLVGLFSIPVGIGLALVARDAMSILFGQHSQVAVQTMELIAVTGCVVGVGFATGDLLFAIGRPGIMVRLNAVMVPLMLGSMWIVAPWGIQYVAMVHLVTAVVFTTARQVVVDHMIGARLVDAAKAIAPGVLVAVCVLVAGLPVRLITSGGLVSMVAIVVAGAVGGLVGLAVCPPARRELVDLVAKIRG